MRRQWIKLYLEVLDDPKMGRLEDHHWRRVIELFLMAAEVDADGKLPALEDMAWRLRTSPEEMAATLTALAAVGILHESPEGQWIVTNFQERQYSESYERVKRYQMKKREIHGEIHGEIHVEKTENSPLKESTSTSPLFLSNLEGGGLGEGENPDEKPMVGQVIDAYQQNIGPVTAMIRDALLADLDDYTGEWVLAAIGYAARSEKRSLAYAEGVLRGWKRDGLKTPPKPGSQTKGKQNDRNPKPLRSEKQPSADDRAAAEEINARRRASAGMPIVQ